MKQTTAARITAVTFTPDRVEVSYSTGTVRSYPDDRIPGTVRAWMAEQPTVMVPETVTADVSTDPEPEIIETDREKTEEAQATLANKSEKQPVNAVSDENGREVQECTQNAVTGLILAEIGIVERQIQSAEPEKPEIRVRISPAAAMIMTAYFLAGVGCFTIWWMCKAVSGLITAGEIVSTAAVDAVTALQKAIQPIVETAVEKIPIIVSEARQGAVNAWEWRSEVMNEVQQPVA